MAARVPENEQPIPSSKAKAFPHAPTTREVVAPTRKCGICGEPTNQSFGFGNTAYYYCDTHKDELFERVTGRKPK